MQGDISDKTYFIAQKHKNVHKYVSGEAGLYLQGSLDVSYSCQKGQHHVKAWVDIGKEGTKCPISR